MYKLTPNKAVNYNLHALEFHSINYIVKLFIYSNVGPLHRWFPCPMAPASNYITHFNVTECTGSVCNLICNCCWFFFRSLETNFRPQVQSPSDLLYFGASEIWKHINTRPHLYHPIQIDRKTHGCAKVHLIGQKSTFGLLFVEYIHMFRRLCRESMHLCKFTHFQERTAKYTTQTKSCAAQRCVCVTSYRMHTAHHCQRSFVRIWYDEVFEPFKPRLEGTKGLAQSTL